MAHGTFILHGCGLMGCIRPTAVWAVTVEKKKRHYPPEDLKWAFGASLTLVLLGGAATAHMGGVFEMELETS